MIKKLNGKNIFSASTDSYGSHIFVIDKINEIISFLNDRFPDEPTLTPEEMDKQLDELYKTLDNGICPTCGHEGIGKA